MASSSRLDEELHGSVERLGSLLDGLSARMDRAGTMFSKASELSVLFHDIQVASNGQSGAERDAGQATAGVRRRGRAASGSS